MSLQMVGMYGLFKTLSEIRPKLKKKWYNPFGSDI